MTDQAAEPMPWQYRLTNRGGGDVRLEVGDNFQSDPAWADDDNALMGQIGLSMVQIGLQFMGHNADSARMLCALALKSSGDIEWSGDEAADA